MANMKWIYRGYVIECDDEFGYIVANDAGEELEFGTRKQAEQCIDEMLRDASAYYQGNPTYYP